jgi:DNA polymerase III subunit gamma/tau
MVYQVLARRWRPRDFSEVEGQIETVTILQNSLNSQKLHHAYLFTGTRGIGKTTIARIFAKALICEQGISAKPCNTCENCIAVTECSCVDVMEIDAASRTKVEDTRAILDNLIYSPSICRFKIYIIDEVHMLSNHSFNALLKSLEEPPSHVKFLLATTDPQKIPITILSRCLEFKLKIFSPQIIAEQLKKILTIEHRLFEEHALLQIAAAANGSMRDALSLLERVLAFSENLTAITLPDVCRVIGIPGSTQIINLLISTIQPNPKQAMQIMNDLFINNCDLFAVLQEMQLLLKNITILQLIPDVSLHDLINKRLVVSKELLDLLLKLANNISQSDLQLYYDIVLTGYKNLPFVPDLQVGFEMIILRMLACKAMPKFELQPDADAINLLEKDPSNSNYNNYSIDFSKVDGSEKVFEPDQDNRDIFTNNAEPHPSNKEIQETKDIKEDQRQNSEQADLYSIINQLNLSRLTKELAENSVFEIDNVGYTNMNEINQIKLIVDNNKKILITKNNIKNLEMAFSQYFHRAVKIKLEIVDFKQCPDLEKKTIKARYEQTKQKFIEKDLSLQQLVNNFDAEIEEITTHQG